MAVELAYTDSGAAGAGPALLILHGLFGSSTNWRSVAAGLSGERRVIAADLRNHGRSPWSERMDYLSMAEDVAALIERLELQAPVLVGHSMGGKTGMALALSRPGLLGALVVVDIAPVSYRDRFTPYIEAMRSAGAMQAASRQEVQSRLNDRIGSQGVTQFLMQNLVTRNDHFDWRVNLAAINMATSELGGFPRELAQRSFDGPVLVVVGENSDYVHERDHAQVLQLFPRAQFQTIKGAGHWVHAEQPRAFTEALSTFLRDAGC